MRFSFVPLLVIIFAAVASPALAAEDVPAKAVTAADLTEARSTFEAWTAAFRAGDYEKQWELTDPRIRYWQRLERWQKRMTRSTKQTGGLAHYEIADMRPVTAEELPATEMGHRYRRGVDYVFILIRSEYGKKQPPQPEFAVMARSEEGWRFGGGTFPFRPLGESAVILDEQDERYYRTPATRR